MAGEQDRRYSLHARRRMHSRKRDREGAVAQAVAFLASRNTPPEPAKPAPIVVDEARAIRAATRLGIYEDWNRLQSEIAGEVIRHTPEDREFLERESWEVIPLSGLSISAMTKRGWNVETAALKNKPALLDETYIPREVALPPTYFLPGSGDKIYVDQRWLAEDKLSMFTGKAGIHGFTVGIRDAVELYFALDAMAFAKDEPNYFLFDWGLRSYDFLGNTGAFSISGEAFAGLGLNQSKDLATLSVSAMFSAANLMSVVAAQPREALIKQGLKVQTVSAAVQRLNIRMFD